MEPELAGQGLDTVGFEILQVVRRLNYGMWGGRRGRDSNSIKSKLHTFFSIRERLVGGRVELHDDDLIISQRAENETMMWNY